MTDDLGEFWFDREPGPLVRPFALTGGRAGTTDRHGLNLITMVAAVRPDAEAASLSRECGQIVRMCHERPLSVAEVAARLDVLLAVAKVLISDLIDEGFLVSQAPIPDTNEAGLNLLQAVLDGVRKL
jgi:Protein of unknown function (DUF742)